MYDESSNLNTLTPSLCLTAASTNSTMLTTKYSTSQMTHVMLLRIYRHVIQWGIQLEESRRRRM